MDKKLNEVTKVTDMAYVPVIMADGSIGQVAKSDLASVVAGSIGLDNFKVRKAQTNQGGGSVYFRGLSNSSITYVVDASDRTKYILSHTYYNIDGSDVVYQTVISSNGLSFGASNNGGTQVINGTTNDVIFYIMYFV